MSMPFEVFFSYAPEDQDWLKKIAKYLHTLQRQKYIQGWHDLNILAGSEWESEITTRLNSAPIILLLVSQDFIASDFCWGVQLQQAMQRHNAGTARVIPIIVRPTDWHDTPFAKLHFLPEDSKPLSTYSNEDEALLQVAQGIRRVVEQMRKPSQTTIAPKRAARTTASPTQQSWNVPLLRNPFFTGRENLLTRLHTSLIETHTMALSQPQAISGLGGVGKTQIALEYAYRYRNDYQAVLWVKASTREELSEDVAALTRTLNLPEQRASKQQESIEAIKRWLATHIGWLLIFDNADDLSPLSDYLPPEPKGHILLTTRAHAMGGLAQKLEVAHMDEAEGIHLLLHRAGLIEQQMAVEDLPAQIYQQALVIFHLLGGLPLALDQAGAYIEETHESLSSYANLYQTQRKDLLERRGGIRSDHLPVATTWNLALQTIEQTNPAAIELIRLCAFLAPDAIPEEMIIAGEEDLSPLLQTITGDRSLWNSASADLLKYSLILRNQTTMSLSIHRLLQAVIRDEMDAQQQEAWEIRIVRMMYYVLPFDSNEDDEDDEGKSEDKDEQDEGKDETGNESNNDVEDEKEYDGPPWKEGQEYLPHALQATEYVAQRTMTFHEAIGLLDDVGSYLYEQGQYLQAEPLLQRSLTIHEEILGPDHPDITKALTNLADLYQAQDKYEQAERLFQRTLTIKERLFGPDHLGTATALYNIAILYANQDKFDKAEPLFLRALTIREHMLGPDHLATADILTNLATLYTDQYKYRKAKSLHKRSVTIHERVLGPNHPSTAWALRHFASFYYHAGRYRRAQRLYQRVLAIQEQALGPEHPDMIDTLENLARLYEYKGKNKQAEQLYQRALTISEHMLGPEHPDTARTLNLFGVFYQFRKGKHKQVESFYQRSLTIREHVFGPDHPETAHGLYVLASHYADQGKYEQAEPLYKRALTIQESMLGPNHRDAVKVRKDYQKLLRKKEGRRRGLFSFFFKKRG